MSNAIKYGDCKPIDVSAGEPRTTGPSSPSAIGASASPPHDHERIFGRFERAASSRHYGGIGLGLWIVKQIIDALGGTVIGRKHAGHGIDVHRRTAALHADKTRHPPTGACASNAPAADTHDAVVTVDLIIAAAPARMTTSTFTTVLLGC